MEHDNSKNKDATQRILSKMFMRSRFLQWKLLHRIQMSSKQKSFHTWEKFIHNITPVITHAIIHVPRIFRIAVVTVVARC